MLKTFLITGLLASCALAQTPASNVAKAKAENAFGPIGITAGLAGPMATVPGQPYSAQAVTQRVQALADGNHIRQEAVTFVARDSQGRVMREETLPDFANHPDNPTLVLITDPVAAIQTTLDPRTKTATKATFLQAKQAAEQAFRTVEQPSRSKGTAGGPGPFAVTPDVSKEDLGTQTMQGLTVKGMRLTRTLPAGAVGNDQPIVITTETWFSPDLQVLVMSKSSDPRMGETTYKLTNIVRAEPDAARFQIPADYTVK